MFSGRATLPDRQQMYEKYERKKGVCGIGKKFHILGQEKELIYNEDFVTRANASSGWLHVSEYEKMMRDNLCHPAR